MNPALQQKIEEVDLSYKRRQEKQDEVWKGFEGEVAELTGIVSQEFKRILNETELSVTEEDIKRKVRINNFEVNYEPQFRGLDIELKEWEVDVDGESFSDRNGYCAYDYLEPVISSVEEADPKIRKFKEDFNVRYISYDCHCGSDHK